MATAYYTKDTKLNIADKHLFDIKTKRSSFGKDIDVNYSGDLSRVIGLDKLEQQVEKAILVKKNTYATAKNLGTSLVIGSFVKDKSTITAEVRDALIIYSNLQQQQRTTNTVKLIGKNIYRTIDILDPNSWEKINTHIISDNTYADTNLIPDTYYNYAVTDVFQDLFGKTIETKIDKTEYVLAANVSTLKAKVNDSFVLIENGKSAILYWNLIQDLTMEEQLRSIINIAVSSGLGDPRSVNVNLKLSNRELTQTQINLLRG